MENPGHDGFRCGTGKIAGQGKVTEHQTEVSKVDKRVFLPGGSRTLCQEDGIRSADLESCGALHREAASRDVHTVVIHQWGDMRKTGSSALLPLA